MLAIYLKVLTHLIRIPASKFLKSNNQSTFTWWVREICLMDGLRPSMIILITALLSSKTKRDVRWLEMCAFERTKPMLSVILLSAMSDFVFLGLLLRMGALPAAGSNTSVIVSHQSSARMPSTLRPGSNELISALVLLCEAAVCFLPVQLLCTNVWLPEMYNMHPDVDLESARTPAKSASWKRLNLNADELLHCL